MTSRERIEKAWCFEEPDRVPFELYITREAQENPVSRRLNDLIAQYADNWNAWSPSWGWFGMDYEDEEATIEETKGEFKRIRCKRHTSAGTFVQITRHPVSTSDYHYEKHFISTLDDLERLTFADRKRISGEGFDKNNYRDRFVTTGIPHPFGLLSRAADQVEFYTWLAIEKEKLHAFFKAYTDYIVTELKRLMAFDVPRYFSQGGLEMAIDPWMSPVFLEELVVPYDKHINETLHSFGGKVRHHCHGNAMDYLETFCRMGMDGIEPCEPPPQANVDLKRAKQLVGDRMLLCGNIP
ncbi:MAG: uroporphyrinogen decarboxylase family protein, partial [Planctomycetota bacterium]